MHNTQERNRMLLEQLPLVQRIARQIHSNLPKHVALEDLVQAGVLGLIDALEKYDQNKHVQFGAYARFRIRGAILDSLRQLDWGPRALRKMARRVEVVRNSLRGALAREPSESELAAELGMQLSDFQILRWNLDRLITNNLPVQSAKESNDREFYDYVAGPAEDTPYSVRLRTEVADLLAKLMAELPGRQRQVLCLYYQQELTMKEIGMALGLGESRISQLHTLGVNGIRSRLEELNHSTRPHE